MKMEQLVTRTQAVRGAIVTGTAQIYRIGLSFVASVILARLLSPGDFGLIAIVSSIVGFVTLIQNLGLTQATIQRDRISSAQSSALFWLLAAVSLVLACVVAACAPL